ncbi:hypothetical protein OROMI_013786 [Orobanche minor]
MPEVTFLYFFAVALPIVMVHAVLSKRDDAMVREENDDRETYSLVQEKLDDDVFHQSEDMV